MPAHLTFPGPIVTPSPREKGIPVPEQPELLVFDFANKCKAYRLPDGTIAVVGQELQLHLLTEQQYEEHPSPDHWVKQLHSHKPRIRTS